MNFGSAYTKLNIILLGPELGPQVDMFEGAHRESDVLGCLVLVDLEGHGFLGVIGGRRFVGQKSRAYHRHLEQFILLSKRIVTPGGLLLALFPLETSIRSAGSLELLLRGQCLLKSIADGTGTGDGDLPRVAASGIVDTREDGARGSGLYRMTGVGKGISRVGLVDAHEMKAVRGVLQLERDADGAGGNRVVRVDDMICLVRLRDILILQPYILPARQSYAEAAIDRRTALEIVIEGRNLGALVVQQRPHATFPEGPLRRRPLVGVGCPEAIARVGVGSLDFAVGDSDLLDVDIALSGVDEDFGKVADDRDGEIRSSVDGLFPKIDLEVDGLPEDDVIARRRIIYRKLGYGGRRRSVGVGLEGRLRFHDTRHLLGGERGRGERGRRGRRKREGLARPWSRRQDIAVMSGDGGLLYARRKIDFAGMVTKRKAAQDEGGTETRSSSIIIEARKKKQVYY